jgi:hypothetical protein
MQLLVWPSILNRTTTPIAHLDIQAERGELALVALAALGRVVRHEEDPIQSANGRDMTIVSTVPLADLKALNGRTGTLNS